MGTVALRDADEVRELAKKHSVTADVDAVDDAGRAYIERMIDAGNEVLKNQYGQPIVELIVPRDMEDEVEELIDKWDINPQGPSVLPQAPSFADQQPDAAEALTAWQFILDDSDNSELDTTGYDLESIASELPCEALWTKAPVVQASLPP